MNWSMIAHVCRCGGRTAVVVMRMVVGDVVVLVHSVARVTYSSSGASVVGDADVPFE